jgi:hypothetical protein
MENVATYSEARSEYTKQLATMIVPALFVWFQNLWSRNAGDKQRCLSLFQNECEEVSRWNQDRITDEVRALIERSTCDYMEELMTAVFVAHTKVLTAVRLSTKQKKLSITVPKLDHFLHRVFKESSRCFWKTPYLFMDVGSVVEKQKNMLQAEQLLTEAISTAVRGMLPVKQILKDYLEDDQDVEESPEVKESSEVVLATPSPAAAPAPAEVSEASPAPPAETAAAPAIVSIDTEPSVKFSEYDTVFDETKGAPEMRFTPKEDEDDDDDDDGPSDLTLKIDESTTSPIVEEDVEDLEKPVPKPESKVKAPTSEIADSDVVILE